MPVMARFYGILIKMYFREHGVPNFHAVYAEYKGVFDVNTLEMIEGDLPPRAQRLVHDWAERYKDELQLWNDDIDWAESEIWINGKITEPDDALDNQ